MSKTMIYFYYRVSICDPHRLVSSKQRMPYPNKKCKPRQLHLGHEHDSPVRTTTSEGLCTYPIIRPDSTESIMAQPTIN